MKPIIYATLISLLFVNPFIMSSGICAEIDIGYDSKYVSEGRNNLIDGGIVWTSVSTALDENFSLAFAYGNASSSQLDYDELNVGIEYASTIDSLDYYINYTRLEFFEDNQSDNEIGLGIAWNAFESFTPFADYVYSSEAEGSFFQIGAESEIIINEHLNITPYIVFTFDYGYASEENNSHNHTGLGATLSYAMSENLAVSIIAEHTIGGFDVKEEGGEDEQTWAGIHLTLTF